MKNTEKLNNMLLIWQKKSKSPPVSKYHQKQYEKFMKTTDKDDLKEAFVEKVEPEPEKVPRYNLRGVNK